MEFFKSLNKNIKYLLLIALILIVYGKFARLSRLYFFWESESLGWILLLVGLIGLFLALIKYRKALGKKNLFQKFFLGITSFILLIGTGMFIGINLSNFPSRAKKFFSTENTIKETTGEINSVLSLPSGSIETANGVGSATLNFLVKGEEGYTIVKTGFIKEGSGKEWKVVGWEVLY